jgi:phosphohistidine phosphatase
MNAPLRTDRRVYLLRHAKSSWKDSGLADHDRPLARRGRRAAHAIGGHLREQGVAPDLVLCSTARRARETLEGIGPSLGRGDVRFEAGLYGAPPGVLLRRLQELPPSVRSVMLIGHNPGLQELALVLARQGSRLEALAAKFPTGALATVAFRGSGWPALDRGSAELIDFIRPRDLDP